MKLSSLCKFLLVNSLIFICADVMSEDAEVWTVASLNWEPYSGAEMVGHGNSIQALSEILKTKNIRLVVKYYPWKRAKEMARGKGFVGYFPAWPEEVIEGFVASPSIDWSEIAAIQTYDNEVIFSSVDELFKNYTVGVVSTYIYPSNVEAAIKKYPHNVEKAPFELSLLKMLVAKRTDVAITDPLAMQYLAEKEGVSNQIIVNKVLTKKELVLAFRQGEDNLQRIKLLQELLGNVDSQVE